MPDLSRWPVLLVEDDTDLRESLALLLEDEGYRVLQAQGGREALERIESARPFVILLDLMMPGMDGQQFLAALRERRPGNAATVPVVVMTAAVPEISVDRQVREVIRKPIRFERFLPLLQCLYREAMAKSKESNGDRS